ncbi:hypothetical protein WA158_001899 [Blastocystis sp. Blastoise]
MNDHDDEKVLNMEQTSFPSHYDSAGVHYWKSTPYLVWLLPEKELADFQKKNYTVLVSLCEDSNKNDDISLKPLENLSFYLKIDEKNSDMQTVTVSTLSSNITLECTYYSYIKKIPISLSFENVLKNDSNILYPEGKSLVPTSLLSLYELSIHPVSLNFYKDLSIMNNCYLFPMQYTWNSISYNISKDMVLRTKGNASSQGIKDISLLQNTTTSPPLYSISLTKSSSFTLSLYTEDIYILFNYLMNSEPLSLSLKASNQQQYISYANVDYISNIFMSEDWTNKIKSAFVLNTFVYQDSTDIVDPCVLVSFDVTLTKLPDSIPYSILNSSTNKDSNSKHDISILTGQIITNKSIQNNDGIHSIITTTDLLKNDNSSSLSSSTHAITIDTSVSAPVSSSIIPSNIPTVIIPPSTISNTTIPIQNNTISIENNTIPIENNIIPIEKNIPIENNTIPIQATTTSNTSVQQVINDQKSLSKTLSSNQLTNNNINSILHDQHTSNQILHNNINIPDKSSLLSTPTNPSITTHTNSYPDKNTSVVFHLKEQESLSSDSVSISNSHIYNNSIKNFSMFSPQTLYPSHHISTIQNNNINKEPVVDTKNTIYEDDSLWNTINDSTIYHDEHSTNINIPKTSSSSPIQLSSYSSSASIPSSISNEVSKPSSIQTSILSNSLNMFSKSNNTKLSLHHSSKELPSPSLNNTDSNSQDIQQYLCQTESLSSVNTEKYSIIRDYKDQEKEEINNNSVDNVIRDIHRTVVGDSIDQTYGNEANNENSNSSSSYKNNINSNINIDNTIMRECIDTIKKSADIDCILKDIGNQPNSEQIRSVLENHLNSVLMNVDICSDIYSILLKQYEKQQKELNNMNYIFSNSLSLRQQLSSFSSMNSHNTYNLATYHNKISNDNTPLTSQISSDINNEQNSQLNSTSKTNKSQKEIISHDIYSDNIRSEDMDSISEDIRLLQSWNDLGGPASLFGSSRNKASSRSLSTRSLDPTKRSYYKKQNVKEKVDLTEDPSSIEEIESMLGIHVSNSPQIKPKFIEHHGYWQNDVFKIEIKDKL